MPSTGKDPNLLVGLDTSDDAGVYKLTDDIALIQTLDFFTPVVDNPYDFGRIAAANALSDVYAMGGKPLTAMNLVGFPTETLGLEILAEILRGGAEKVCEAGAVLLGGHSVEDKEPKYGLSVTGIIHPDRVLTNAAAKPGDVLILTKPLGIGIITTALKAGMASEEAEREATAVMSALNKDAAETMQEVGAHACTDVTGFGLLGHALELAKASSVNVRIFAAEVPVLAPAREYVRYGLIPAGTRRNLKYVAQFTRFDDNLEEEERIILADTITSGGLLISLPEEKAARYMELSREKGLNAAIIGEVIPGKGNLEVYKES
ncbi:selenide, water dikinase [Thermincola ferriacetica]|uniref:Selenide, water dikinase n=1 Tax=Thermincola ferriacetica TaxID=281456 RepID=A0A0L6W090_9FIRM|nr:selenide, water dikinase [Thermincola ferriacetica]